MAPQFQVNTLGKGERPLVHSLQKSSSCTEMAAQAGKQWI